MIVFGSSGTARWALKWAFKFLGVMIALFIVLGVVRQLTMTPEEKEAQTRRMAQAREAAAAQRAASAASRRVAATGAPSLTTAMRLMRTGQFAAALAAYQALEAAQPELRATCQGQIGAAYYMLGKYDEALTAYAAAIEAGEDRAMMQSNIDEARAALAKKKR